MKNKLTLMNKRQEITDEELERFKDFDALLAKHQQTITNGSVNWIRWTAIGSTVVLGIIVAGYFLTKQEIVPVKIQPPLTIQKEPTREEVKNKPESLQSEQPEETESKSGKKQPVKEEVVITEQKPTESKPSSPIYVQAEPVDGYVKLYEYFNRELIYPPVAVKDSIQGMLTVSFIISHDGSVANIQFANTLGKPFEEEAIRLIKNMPAWKPATIDGDSVPSKMTLPLKFQIQNSAERKKE